VIPLPAWLTGIGAKIALAGAIALAILLGILKLIGIGRDQERYKASTKALEQVKEAKDVEARVDSATDAERAGLRDKWTR
jgi:hypothetical protein